VNFLARLHNTLCTSLLALVVVCGMLVPSVVGLLDLAGLHNGKMSLEHGTVHLSLADAGHDHHHDHSETEGHHERDHDDADQSDASQPAAAHSDTDQSDSGHPDADHGAHVPSIQRDGHLKPTSPLPLPILQPALATGLLLTMPEQPAAIPSWRIVPTAFSPPVELQRTVVLVI
jgi:hypothetical protein